VTGESDWHGTTTACGALLHWKEIDGTAVTPLLYVTQLGDSQVMVVRPSEKKAVFKTKEQWHWFDCPRQLGTNSPDTPATDAVVDEVSIQEGDVVLAMSDGVIDNLWSHEIVECVSDSVARWAKGEGRVGRKETDITDGGMTFVAHELVERAKKIALDPFAESPFMEHAIEEGLPSVGGMLNVSTLGLTAVFADVMD
jgi:protein phosphatase PTC7